MKVIFALRNIADFRHFAEVVRQLSDNGHTVKVMIEENYKPNTTDRALRECLSEASGVELEFVSDRLARKTRDQIRYVINYATYFKPQHPSANLAWRWRKRMKVTAKLAVTLPVMRHLVLSERGQQTLQRMQERAPLEPVLTQKLKDYQPDVVIASPFIKRSALDVEITRAALALGIPTIVAVMSWDNLTSRGTFHAIPDMTFVWNRALVKEAVEIHDVPKDKIFVTGAPTFDFWFDMKPTLSRGAFCERVGLDPDKPFITYLGSSWSIAQDETSYVQEFAEVLRKHPDARHIQILVRPHPLNLALAKELSVENATIWPRGGAWPDSTEPRQDYFNTLFYSDAVMGVNTSAFLDAAVVDKPCVTALTERYRHSQTGRGHFAHLLHGDFIETVHSFSEAAAKLAAIVNGEDSKADNRRHFVKDFIRPHGLQRRASEIFAEAVEMVAQRKSAAEIEAGFKPIQSLHVEPAALAKG